MEPLLPPLTWESRGEEQTEALAGRLAQCAAPGLVIALIGPLGAGKTAFARGFLHGLGVRGVAVTSPTFTLVNPYDQGRLPVAHFDCYRLAGPDELEEMGGGELLDGPGVALVEWPERAEGALPADRLEVTIAFPGTGDDERLITMEARGPRSGQVLRCLKELPPS